MSDEFKIEIVNPEKSFLSKEDVNEAVRLIKVATQSAATDPTTGLVDMDLSLIHI